MLWRATTSRKVNVYATSSTVDAITSHVILNYNKGVENMYKRDQHYNEKISTENLYKELDTHYNGETDLVRNLMSYAITDELIETRHELSCANEELWSLNDWPEDQGFQSSDRAEYIRRITETVASERKFLQVEDELVQINKLTECPNNDTVRKYMIMNEEIRQGLTKGGQ